MSQFQKAYDRHCEYMKSQNLPPMNYKLWLESFIETMYNEVAKLRTYVRRYEPNATALRSSAAILESLGEELNRIRNEDEKEIETPTPQNTTVEQTTTTTVVKSTGVSTD